MSDTLPPPDPTQAQQAPVLTGDPMIDAILAGGGGLPDMAGNDPIGGIFNPGGPIDPVTGKFLGPLAQTVENGIGAPYTADFVDALWRGLPLEDRIRLQDELVALGLTGSAIPGEFDDGTVRGVEQLLSLSNRAGTTWRATIGRLRDLETQGLLDRAQQEEFQAAPYITPDYATLAQQVKGTFRQQLGRDPNQSEMAQLTSELQGFDKQSYQQQVAAERAQFEGRSPTVESVDPVARFQEFFDKRYAPERAFIRDKATAADVQEFTESTTGLLAGMSREEPR